jgi:hypothetical protein
MAKKMKSNKLLLFIVGIITFISYSFSVKPDKFNELLTRSDLIFTQPENFTSVEIVDQNNMQYEYALKHNTKNFEVRYAIRPLDELIKTYDKKEKNKKEGDINIHPNTLYKTLLQSTTMNISGGYLPEMVVFDSLAVRQEFNADWGATTYVEVGNAFGANYKYCITVAIHKNNVADAYLFFLSDNTENFDDIMLTAFHSLKFK